MIRIRPYKESDAESILSWVDSEDTFLMWTFGLLGDPPITYEQFQKTDEYMRFTAADEDEPVGFYIARNPHGNLNELRFGYGIVKPNRRGQGVGKAMLSQGLIYAFEIYGAERVTLGVYEKNYPGIRCYSAIGFTETGVQEHYTINGEDYLVYEMECRKNDILPEISTRRSVRQYKDRDVTDEQVAALLEAARLAPSGSNMQPWDFIVVRSKEMREQISTLDHNQKWMLTAPVFIICVGNEKYRGDGDMERVIRDSAIATEHILLQAEHMGLATCWTGWYDQSDMRALLGLDSHCYIAGVVTVGYADEKPPARPRRTIDYEVLR